MDKQAVIEELLNIIGAYLKDRGLDLVELIYRYEGRDLFLRVLADKPEGGITLDECTRINREIGDILDGKDMIPGKYVLEVSSPGVDRPLKTKSDFSRCINKKIKLFLYEAINGKIEFDGIIKSTTEDSVCIQTSKGVMDVPLDKINKAKQII